VEIDVGGGGIAQVRVVTRIDKSLEHHEAVGALFNNRTR
jgi:hypothetical protein